MVKSILKRAAWFTLCGFLTFASVATAQDRPADKILADIKAVEMPPVPQNRNDRTAIQQFLIKRQKAVEQKAEFIGELLKSYPDSPELPDLILERWIPMSQSAPKADAANAEIESVLTKSKNEKLVTEAAFVKAVIEFRKAGSDAEAPTLLPIAEEFIKKAPKDPRGAMILNMVASKMTDVAKANEILSRIEKDYPDSQVVKKIAAERRVKEAIGKPFKIEFTEAIKGSQISSATLKGKVIIVDFWATWCGPCVAEMPKMKELYAKYKDKGVEFIGVSLDAPKSEGGYDKLKAFVEKNKIEWPQYYQGNGWESDFSMSWGISAIPAVFAVDADGNLFSNDARGKLEELIPELLEKADKFQKPEVKP
jgi:thiol-disulfide isomerase/thioredoxin